MQMLFFNICHQQIKSNRADFISVSEGQTLWLLDVQVKLQFKSVVEVQRWIKGNISSTLAAFLCNRKLLLLSTLHLP